MCACVHGRKFPNFCTEFYSSPKQLKDPKFRQNFNFRIYKITNFNVTRQGATRSTVYGITCSVTDSWNRKQEYCSISSWFSITRKRTACSHRDYIAVCPQTHYSPSSLLIKMETRWVAVHLGTHYNIASKRECRPLASDVEP